MLVGQRRFLIRDGKTTVIGITLKQYLLQLTLHDKRVALISNIFLPGSNPIVSSAFLMQ